MSTTAPFVVNSASTSTASSNSGGVPSQVSGASREMTGTRLFQFYMESFFKIPKDIKTDLIYCQRTLKSFIKVHQMVLEVFQQQPDADPYQKKRILDELEAEICEINAEQSFLFLRLRRIIDEFYKMLKKNGIPSDIAATNAYVSREIVPFVNDESIEIMPITVLRRNSEDKLIEKYFEVSKETYASQPEQPQQCVEVIDLDDDGGNVVEKIVKSQKRHRGHKREQTSMINSNVASNGESLLRNLNGPLSQTSLLKPMNQRPMNQELGPVDVKPQFAQKATLAQLYKQQKAEKEKEVVLPVSTNVRMSRLNLTEALKRAQAAARGPAAAPPPPPPPPPAPQPIVVAAPAITKQKVSAAKARAATRAAARAATVKSPQTTSSSGASTPERGPSPPHAFWPDELEETRTKPEEYGKEKFLQMFELYSPETKALMQQRRSKRRRRCVQNNNYHYGASATTGYEPEPKQKKRKAFLLSPQVKKTLPAKRNKRRSADKDSESNSVPPSRSASSSPNDKRSCNECFKGGFILEQCDECKLHYHPQCHREKDDEPSSKSLDLKEILNDPKFCPTCKRNNDKLIKKEFLINKNLQNTAKELELKMAQETERHQVLEKMGKQYKIQMNNLFKIVNSLKSDGKSSNATTTTSTGTKSNASMAISNTANNYVIHLD